MSGSAGDRGQADLGVDFGAMSLEKDYAKIRVPVGLSTSMDATNATATLFRSENASCELYGFGTGITMQVLPSCAGYVGFACRAGAFYAVSTQSGATVTV